MKCSFHPGGSPLGWCLLRSPAQLRKSTSSNISGSEKRHFGLSRGCVRFRGTRANRLSGLVRRPRGWRSAGIPTENVSCAHFAVLRRAPPAPSWAALRCRGNICRLLDARVVFATQRSRSFLNVRWRQSFFSSRLGMTTSRSSRRDSTPPTIGWSACHRRLIWPSMQYTAPGTVTPLCGVARFYV